MFSTDLFWLFKEKPQEFKDCLEKNKGSYIKVSIYDSLTEYTSYMFFLINDNFIKFLEANFSAILKKEDKNEYVTMYITATKEEIINEEEYKIFAPIAAKLNIISDAFKFKDDLDINKVLKEIKTLIENEDEYHVTDYFNII